MGTPMKKIFNEIGGGYKEPVKAFQIGGPLGGVVPLSEIENLNLDFQEFTAKSFMLGHASVVSIPQEACEIAVKRIVSSNSQENKFQVAYIAMNKNGDVGSYSIEPGFTYMDYFKGENN